jgi:hypothetical protein
MDLPGRYPEALPGLPGDAGEERGRVLRVQPIQGAPQAVVVEQLRRDPRTQQVLHRLGGEKRRHQVQPAIAEAESIEDHGHRRGAHAHLLLRGPGHRIQVRRQPDLLADAGDDPQMIQPLDAHAAQSPHIALLPRSRPGVSFILPETPKIGP